MFLRRIAYGFSSAIISMSALFVLVAPAAHAANVTWDGEGSDDNFSTAANWSGDTLPTASDVIVFDADYITGTETLNNDISNLVISGVSFVSTTPCCGPQKNVVITGNSLTINGNIAHSPGAFYWPQMNVDIILGADMIIDGSFSIGTYQITDKTLDLNSHNLLISSSLTTSSAIYNSIIGTGNVSISSLGTIDLHGLNSFSGSVQVSGSVSAHSLNAFGNSANSITVSGSAGRINFCNTYGGTVQNPFVLNSSYTGNGVISSTSTCGWFNPVGFFSDADIIFSGPVTLFQNASVFPVGNMTFNGELSGTYALTLPDGLPGSLILNGSPNNTNSENGTYRSNLLITTVNDTLGTTYSISYNQEVVINLGSIAGDIYMGSGRLKGLGTVGNINMVGGSVAPGMSPGILNSSNFTANGGTFDVEIGGTGSGEYDQLNVTGTVDLGSVTNLNVSDWSGYRPVVGNSFTIINNDGSDVITGTFSGLAQGATVVVDGVTYTISYTGGDGNDVVLTVTNVSAAATVPTAPNTGIQRLTNNPLLTIVITLMLVAGIGFIARTQFVQPKNK